MKVEKKELLNIMKEKRQRYKNLSRHEKDVIRERSLKRYYKLKGN